MIYLDNAATARPNERAMARANKLITENFYNPSARYRGGDAVSRELKAARETILRYVADPAEFGLVFTSGGTEADNQAVFSSWKRGNIVTTAGEHAAVYQSCMEMKSRGAELRLAPLRADGSVDEDALLALVDAETSLVSVVHVNNETGAVNDVFSLAARVKSINPRTVFHSDGVQAYGKIPVRLTKNIDLYSISAHKIGALKGTGALIKNNKCNLRPFMFGGGQEGNLRSGTENTYGISCFRYAAEEAFRMLEADGARINGLKEKLFLLLEKSLFTRISPAGGSPYILCVSAVGLKGEVLQRILWDEGVVVGTGSACSSKKPHSRVIEACGYDARTLDGILRLSLSPQTTSVEIEHCAGVMNAVAKQFKERLG